MFSVVGELIGPDAQITATSAETESREDAAPHGARLHYRAGDVPIVLDMRWSETGGKVRGLEVATSSGLVVIDITRGTVLVNGVPVDRQERPSDMMRREYEAMLEDWAAHIAARRSSCGARELEMLHDVGKFGGDATSPG